MKLDPKFTLFTKVNEFGLEDNKVFRDERGVNTTDIKPRLICNPSQTVKWICGLANHTMT